MLTRGGLQNTPGLLLLTLSACMGLPRVQAAGPNGNCTAVQGQAYIDAGQYGKAIQEFSCVIQANPTEGEGYRGRIEAELLAGQFSNALRDAARITAYVVPVHPDAQDVMLAGYTQRLKANPNDTNALTGASFLRWSGFDYAQARQLLEQLLAAKPGDVYGNLFRGSARVLSGAQSVQGVADLERAIVLVPASPDVRFIVSDAYTYGIVNPSRAFAEASLALHWGLDTPRIRAILALAYQRFGDELAGALQFNIHINQVTTQSVATTPLAVGGRLTLPLAPGRTYEIPVNVTAGQTLSIATSSRDFYDTILVLLDPNGSPVVASDDYVKYFAGLDWVAPVSGTYRLRGTSFEAIDTGELVVDRK